MINLPLKLQNLNYEEFKVIINIGFCQPKFYKRSVWLKSKAMMDLLVCPLNLACAHDFGRGKGKYDSKFGISEIVDKAWEHYTQEVKA